MKKCIVIFEIDGGSDKGPDGLRADTMPIANALISRGWEAEVIVYSDDNRERILEYVLEVADAYVSRINPGNFPNGDALYYDMLYSLSDAGVIPFSHPDLMKNYGAKSALEKLVGTSLVPSSTCAYHSFSEFTEKFPQVLAKGERVVKQNRGSTGKGVWRVGLNSDASCSDFDGVSLDTEVSCTEAVDNHTTAQTLSDFMYSCSQYFMNTDDMLLDMPFIEGIKKGELRVLMVGTTPLYVVHKKPKSDGKAFSATLYSDAEYRYDLPEQWPELTLFLENNLNVIFKKLGNYGIPLLWTTDFMMDLDESSNVQYILGEINCSCVGFTSHLHLGIQDEIAEQIINTITEELMQLHAA